MPPKNNKRNCRHHEGKGSMSKRSRPERSALSTDDQASQEPGPSRSRWTDVFLVYASIYASAHPESVQGLLKYLHGIRLGASSCGEGDLGWKKYDEQFRLCRKCLSAINSRFIIEEP
uniref:Uncharacterized protein n=1 Tax=Magallana gigas TaxID=29159 RepID=A0A8W8MG70_MAGGI